MIREKKQFSFLLPAVLTAALVFNMLPQTQGVLREIPAKLELVAEAEAKEPVKRKAADDGNGEAVPAGTGNYEDGVYTGSSNGYGGTITVQVTVEKGQIVDILILSAPGETDPYFSLAKSLLDTVKTAQTWEVDAVSGATYSSRGILGAIQNAITGETVENEEPPSVEPVGTTSQDEFKDPAAYKDGTYYGTADGFGGSIRVEVVIKDGKIESIRIVDASGETGDYLSRARGVISRILGKGSPNVDAVSGATYSSTGIINAVKRALSQAVSDGKDEGAAVLGNVDPAKIDKIVWRLEGVDDPSEYKDGTYTGTADGFGGEITVEVTIKKGKIAKVRLVSAPDETAEYLTKAKGVIPAIVKAGSPNVDAVSGATYSSTGIINAVRAALSKAAAESGGDDPGDGGDEPGDGGDDGGTGDGGDDSGTGDGGETTTQKFADGTYSGSGWCDDGEEFYYEIHVTIRVEGGKIVTVSVAKGEDESDSPEDNDFYLNWAVSGRKRSGVSYPGIPAQITSKQSAEVDTVSGATYSSNTIRSIAAKIISEIPLVETPASGTEGAETSEAGQADENAAQQMELPVLVAPSQEEGGEAGDGNSAENGGDGAADPAEAGGEPEETDGSGAEDSSGSGSENGAAGAQDGSGEGAADAEDGEVTEGASEQEKKKEQAIAEFAAMPGKPEDAEAAASAKAGGN